MSRIPFEVKTADVILVVIFQGGSSGLINNETELGGKVLLYICGLGVFFHFLGETN